MVTYVWPFSGHKALKGLWVLLVSIFQYLISNQFKIKTAGSLEVSEPTFTFYGLQEINTVTLSRILESLPGKKERARIANISFVAG